MILCTISHVGLFLLTKMDNVMTTETTIINNIIASNLDRILKGLKNLGYNSLMEVKQAILQNDDWETRWNFSVLHEDDIQVIRDFYQGYERWLKQDSELDKDILAKGNWFDLLNKEHIKAYMILKATGSWPDSIINTIPGAYLDISAIQNILAEAYLNSSLCCVEREMREEYPCVFEDSDISLKPTDEQIVELAKSIAKLQAEVWAKPTDVKYKRFEIKGIANGAIATLDSLTGEHRLFIHELAKIKL